MELHPPVIQSVSDGYGIWRSQYACVRASWEFTLLVLEQPPRAVILTRS